MLLEGVEDTYSFTGTFHGVVLRNKSQQVKKKRLLLLRVVSKVM